MIACLSYLQKPETASLWFYLSFRTNVQLQWESFWKDQIVGCDKISVCTPPASELCRIALCESTKPVSKCIVPEGELWFGIKHLWLAGHESMNEFTLPLKATQPAVRCAIIRHHELGFGITQLHESIFFMAHKYI